jgi:solute carrier family 30 (zinc transporter), member 1
MLDIGVIVAAVIFLKVDSPKRFYADPAVSLAISLFIFCSAIPMSMSTVSPREHICEKLISNSIAALKSGRILLEASPIHLNLAKVKEDLLSVCFSFEQI